MRIQIETRSRWRFTLTSPKHDIREHPAPASAKSFAHSSPACTSEVPTLNSKGLKRSLETFGIDEEDRPKNQCSSEVSRRRSFRKRICRFVVHFCRTIPEDRTTTYKYASYDGVDLLPPYEQYRSAELAAASVQELPGFVPEMTGDPPVCELDSDASENRPMQHIPLNASQGRDMVARLEVPNRSMYSASTYGMPHPVPQLDRFQYLANLETNLQSLPPPGMISGSNSHGSSPVSPFTPTPESGVERQQYQGPIYAGGNMSPQSLISPSNSQYSMHGLGPDSKASYPSLSILDSPVGSFGGSSTTHTPITAHESFQTQISTYFPPSSSSSAQNPSTFQMATYDPFANQQANVQVGMVWQSFEDVSPNALNDQDSGWYNRPNLGANTLNQTIPEEAHRIYEMATHTHEDLEPHTHANSHSHLPGVHNEGSPQHVSPSTKKSGNYPPVACDVCGTQFNGQYRRGNLRRHARELHNVDKAAMDNACRVCKRVYNRKDATKKHEWKKHRLLDAKPTKRRD